MIGITSTPSTTSTRSTSASIGDRDRRWLSLVWLVGIMSLVLSLVTVTPARAVGQGPGPEDLAEMVLPDAVPGSVWRADTRTPEALRGKGLEALGDNYNLADHLMNSNRTRNSGWISTAGDEDTASFFGQFSLKKPNPDVPGSMIRADSYTLYEIAPDARFTSMEISMHKAMVEHPEWGDAWEETSKSKFFGDLQAENEWAAKDRIDWSQVKSTQKWSRDPVTGEWSAEERVPSAEFVEPTTRPTLEPHPITEETLCTRRAVCDWSVPDEDALADLHADRFSGDFDDVTFELKLDRLADDEYALLAPFPETSEVIEGIGASSQDFADFEALGADLTEAFGADSRALAAASADLDLLASVGKSAGKVLDYGSELVPYLGIAATGYAIRGDIDDGRWGDLAADGIAEALQTAEVAFPEFIPFLEPLLMADLALEALGDAVWGWLHPKPAISPEHRDELDSMLDGVDAILPNITTSWDAERKSALDTFYAEHVLTAQADLLANKLKSDLAVLRGSYEATQFELARHERVVFSRAKNDGERVRVTGQYSYHT
ncbi:ADP-ribosylating toxin CARDS [Frondihabitans sp. 762G35]|uniref:hypothetical protein n=1 Tax=Frondihabitans sp. 762G35 TaxID=1446794 RepID=UPI000D2052CD|nr:hypothetical protein [Frondihabitans sp. 762G35]ARC57590.1 ADP-ribosylating toxin CARDS [Frondihabitans sp. 762G35]